MEDTKNCSISGFWGKEDIDESILLGLYTMTLESYIYDLPWDKPTKADIACMLSLGSYLPPDDRISIGNQIDIQNDGLPKYATWSTAIDKTDSDYLQYGFTYKTMLLRMINKLPTGVLPLKSHGTPYKMMIFYANTEGNTQFNRGQRTLKEDTGVGYVYVESSYVNIHNNDIISPTKDTRKLSVYKNRVKHDTIKPIVMAATTATFWADRKHLWNVEAYEPWADVCDLHVTFGVYPSQVKSLFYARDIPITKSGRKSPILHWVSAHQRRIKQGIDINIRKHLRGTNNFEMAGTRFRITSPEKTCLVTQ